jgi:hypothetical protein
VPPPPLVLSLLHRLLSADVSPPVCLLFASWLLRFPCVAPPPPLVLSTCCLCLATRHHLFPLVCRLVDMSHLVAPPPPCITYCHAPPHLSIFNPLPSFTPAGSCVASCCAASASRPLINAAASRHAGNSTSCSPLAWPRLVAALPLVAPQPHIHQLVLPFTSTYCRSCSCCPGRLSYCLPSACNSATTTYSPLPLPLMVGCCIFHRHSCLPPAFVFSPTVMHCAIINAANVMLLGVLCWLLKFGGNCWNQPPTTQGMIAYNLSILTAWLVGPPFDLAMSNNINRLTTTITTPSSKSMLAG